jgi:hypothetical protein
VMAPRCGSTSPRDPCVRIATSDASAPAFYPTVRHRLSQGQAAHEEGVVVLQCDAAGPAQKQRQHV